MQTELKIEFIQMPVFSVAPKIMHSNSIQISIHPDAH